MQVLLQLYTWAKLLQANEIAGPCMQGGACAATEKARRWPCSRPDGGSLRCGADSCRGALSGVPAPR